MALQICAFKYISLSEIQKEYPQWNKYKVNKNWHEFLDLLFALGCDINEPIVTQEDVQHRNLFNETVTCNRYVCHERVDKEWVESGYASIEAVDKSKNCKILTDLYRLKGLVE